MGRAPCSEKMGLMKGSWTPDEDQILTNYINTHGHNNWRALPKQAGLLRCGKSCRLRWKNYLRPHIKRGNFTGEENDTIIQLHDMWGNRWSAIAAKLPGRTDNEIKNVWHTHLKKRLQQPQNTKGHEFRKRFPKPIQPKTEKEPVNFPTTHHVTRINNIEVRPVSPQHCSSSDVSTLITSDTNDHNNSCGCSFVTSTTKNIESLALGEDFWSEVLSAHNSDDSSSFQAIGNDMKLHYKFSPLVTEEGVHFSSSSSMCNDGLDSWYDVYTIAEEVPEKL